MCGVDFAIGHSSPYCFQTLGGSGTFSQHLIGWVLPLLAVPRPATSQEAFGDSTGVAGQPPPGQDSVQCHPRPSQQQNAGESQPWPCLV